MSWSRPSVAKHKSDTADFDIPQRHPLDRLLHYVTDGSLAAAIIVAPLILGGRHPVGELVLVSCIGIAAATFAVLRARAIDFRWKLSGVEWLLLAGFALLALQLIPLPASLLAKLSPAITDLLPLWIRPDGSEFNFGPWSQISLTPSATRASLAMYSAYVLFFLLVYHRSRRIQDVEWLLKCVAVSGFIMALIGLAQFFAGNGKFLWIYSHPYRDTLTEVRAAFHNENHFVQFMALSIGPVIWWIHRCWRLNSTESVGALASRNAALHRLLPYGLAAALGLMLLASLLTFARVGPLALAVGVLSLVLATRVEPFRKKALLAMGGSGLVAAMLLTVVGYDTLAQQLKRLAPGSLNDFRKEMGRQEIWSANYHAFQRFWPLGTGVGSHREIIPTFFPAHTDVEYTHAESSYLQVATETGIVGLVLVLTAIALCGSWWFQSMKSHVPARQRAASVAVAGGLLATVVQSLWDFVWYIPACISIVIVLAALACRLREFSLEGDKAPDSTDKSSIGSGLTVARWCLVAGVLCVALWIVQDRLHPALASPYWDDYLSNSLAANGTARHGKSAELGKVERTDPGVLGTLRDDLEQTILHDPQDARAHLRLASIYLMQFDVAQKASENAMGLAQIRDAAIASQFPSRESLDNWLQAAIGEDRNLLDMALQHARRALELCPLQGEAYAYLAELSFLNGAGVDQKDELISQAIQVRPYSAPVHFVAGSEAALDGSADLAIAHWRIAFQKDPDYQSLIIELLAGKMPAAAFLEQFHPDTGGLQRLTAFYQKSGLHEEARVSAAPWAESLEKLGATVSGQEAFQIWSWACTAYDILDQPEDAIRAAQTALTFAPDDYGTHRLLSQRLAQESRWSEAQEQLQWCFHRRPGDDQLRHEMTAIERELTPAKEKPTRSMTSRRTRSGR